MTVSISSFLHSISRLDNARYQVKSIADKTRSACDSGILMDVERKIKQAVDCILESDFLGSEKDLSNEGLRIVDANGLFYGTVKFRKGACLVLEGNTGIMFVFPEDAKENDLRVDNTKRVTCSYEKDPDAENAPQYETVDGKAVELIAQSNGRGSKPIKGYIEDDTTLTTWHANGRAASSPTSRDLVTVRVENGSSISIVRLFGGFFEEPEPFYPIRLPDSCKSVGDIPASTIVGRGVPVSSPILYAEYKRWQRKATSKLLHGDTPIKGLCEIIGAKSADDLRQSLVSEMKDQFKIAGLDGTYPFDKNSTEWCMSRSSKTMHLNEARLSWVQNRIADYEKHYRAADHG